MWVFSCIWKNEWSPAIIVTIFSSIIALCISIYFGISNPRNAKKEKIEDFFENFKKRALVLKPLDKEFLDIINQFSNFIVKNTLKKRKSKQDNKYDLCSYSKHKTSLYKTLMEYINVKEKPSVSGNQQLKLDFHFLILNTDIEKISGKKFYISFKTLCSNDLKAVEKQFSYK